MPQVQMPDGTVVEMPDQLDPAMGARLRAFQSAQQTNSAAPVATPTAPRPWQEGDPVPEGHHTVTMDGGKKELRGDFTFNDALSSLPPVGIMETALEGVTGLASKAISGITGMFTGAKEFGDNTQGRDAASENIANVQDKLTYEPRSTSAADIKAGLASVLGLADPIAEPIQRGVDSLPNGVSTVINAAVEAAPDVIPLAASLRPVAAAMKARPPKAPKEAPPEISPKVADLRKAGYNWRPSDIEAVSPGSKPPGRIAESLNDPADLKKDMTKKNQQVTTRLAAEELGLKNTNGLSDAEFNKVKAPHVKVYDEAEKALNRVDTPPEFKALLQEAHDRAKFKPGTSPSVTRTIGALRRRASKQIQAKDVATQEAGYADQAMADKLEDAFGKRLEALGDGDVLQKYKDSRVAFAKIYNVEQATRGSQVDAHALYKQKRRGAPLTGRLAMIADAAEHLPNATKHSSTTAAAGVPKADTLAGVAKEGVSKVIRNIPGMKGKLDVRSPQFQDRLGKPADEAARSYFSDYGKKQNKPEPRPAPAPQLGTGNVEMSRPRPATPPLANDLARDLELVPDDVSNPQVLPEVPDMMTADVVPPTRGDIDFDPGAPPLAQTLARDLELESRAAPSPDSVEWTPPDMSGQMSPDVSLAPSNIADDLVSQLGLSLESAPRAPSNLWDIFEGLDMPELISERPAALAAPPGRAGKLRKK